MKQLAQKLADGKQIVVETPEPIATRGCVVVRNWYSAISSGTEGATARAARKSLVAKALARPKDVKAVVELAKRQGVAQAYRAASKKLDAYSPLGYSCAGIVEAVGADVSGARVGDKVACAGVGFANHAEVVCVPINLCVKLSRDADLKTASYNALGAIALQGVRQADLRLGETCVVVGLGIVGTLACKLLDASGVATLGIDVNRSAVAKARELGIEAYSRDDPSLFDRLAASTDALGADAVVLAAGTSSLDPINLAGRLARKKGRVVVLGDVPTGFDREDYYRKELELRMSCSYGPGRYDLNYEEKGIDYPAAYARWTERRNMQAFQRLILDGKLRLDALTTHVFSLDDAPNAYDMILSRSEPFLGTLIEYDAAKSGQRDSVSSRDVVLRATPTCEPRAEVGCAFIGAGSYAQGALLPNLPREGLRRVAVATKSGTTSKRVAEKFGFEVAVSDPASIFASREVDAVFIATRHNLHADFVLRALRADKNVFVEKPLCLTLDEFSEIRDEWNARAQRDANAILAVGFNRRFAPLAQDLKARLTDAPLAISIRVNAGAISSDSWIQDPQIGGGRILGEACHFIDFAAWLAGSPCESVYASAMEDPSGLRDVAAIHARFLNGAVATVDYFANGSKAMPKERIEVFQSGRSAVLDDFRTLRFYDEHGRERARKSRQDKGQRAMLRAVADALLGRSRAPIEADSVFNSTLATFAALESLASRQEIKLT